MVAMCWEEKQSAMYVFSLRNSMSMLKKVQKACVCRPWWESVRRPRLQCVGFICMLGHERVMKEQFDKHCHSGRQ